MFTKYYLIFFESFSQNFFSHSLFYIILPLASYIFVPIKIIYTTDTEIISSIVKATNRQSPVPEEAFVVLNKYHKEFNQKIIAQMLQIIFLMKIHIIMIIHMIIVIRVKMKMKKHIFHKF